MPVDRTVMLTPGLHFVSQSDCIHFTAQDRVKLSYHSDGFVQFSSEIAGRIVSGRDPSTGQPKGLGLFTNPLKKPSWSGPSVGITIWGIDEFDETDEVDEAIIFEPNDWYYRGCTPGEANGWQLAIYPFPINVTPPVRYHEGRALLDVASLGLGGFLSPVVQMQVIHLRQEQMFLGLYVNRMMVAFPPKSGWALAGPRGNTQNRKGHVLMATYAADIPEAWTENFPSLSRKSGP
jgi:hypothetical protein